MAEAENGLDMALDDLIGAGGKGKGKSRKGRGKGSKDSWSDWNGGGSWNGRWSEKSDAGSSSGARTGKDALDMALDDLVSGDGGKGKGKGKGKKGKDKGSEDSGWGDWKGGSGSWSGGGSDRWSSGSSSKWGGGGASSQDWGSWGRSGGSGTKRGHESSDHRATKSKVIKVTNIPSALTDEDITEAFEAETGKILSCDMSKRGTAVIRFARAEDAMKAAETFDRGELNGKIILVTVEPGY